MWERCIRMIRSVHRISHPESLTVYAMPWLTECWQLHLQMVAGNTFPFYSEARITFLPTYKYNNGTDTYDTSYSPLSPFPFISHSTIILSPPHSSLSLIPPPPTLNCRPCTLSPHPCYAYSSNLPSSPTNLSTVKKPGYPPGATASSTKAPTCAKSNIPSPPCASQTTDPFTRPSSALSTSSMSL